MLSDVCWLSPRVKWLNPASSTLGLPGLGIGSTQEQPPGGSVNLMVAATQGSWRLVPLTSLRGDNCPE